jgi:hypothetical protein
MTMIYTSPFGAFEIPADVRSRAFRLKVRFGRYVYLDDWCEYQWLKGLR